MYKKWIHANPHIFQLLEWCKIVSTFCKTEIIVLIFGEGANCPTKFKARWQLRYAIKPNRSFLSNLDTVFETSISKLHLGKIKACGKRNNASYCNGSTYKIVTLFFCKKVKKTKQKIAWLARKMEWNARTSEYEIAELNFIAE